MFGCNVWKRRVGESMDLGEAAGRLDDAPHGTSLGRAARPSGASAFLCHVGQVAAAILLSSCILQMSKIRQMQSRLVLKPEIFICSVVPAVDAESRCVANKYLASLAQQTRASTPGAFYILHLALPL